MEWSKLKNVILLMLVCVNLILLLLVGTQAGQDRRYRDETRQAAVQVLEQGGVTYALEEIPDDLTLPVLTVTRDRSGEADMAAALLGEVTQQGESEVRPRYVGPGGSAEFSMNGSFTIALQPGTWTREPGQDYEQASARCLEAMGFSGVLQDFVLAGDEAALTYCQQWDGAPLFSCAVTLSWSEDSLLQVEGQRLAGSAAASEQSLLSTPTILVRFLEGVNKGGYVCSRIDQMTCGYLSSGNSRQIQLNPVWRFTTDTGAYDVDARTGDFSPAE